jgi:uncharacterized membrane protein
MSLFLIGLIGFLGIHLTHAVAPGLRGNLISKLGVMGWKGLYTLISIAFFILIILGYKDAQAATIIFAEPPAFLKHLNALLSPLALILVVAGSLPRGFITKTFRHPQLVGVKLWALGHLLCNWDLTSFILFGSFLAWAVIVRISIKRRPAVTPKAPSALWDGIAVLAGIALTAWIMMGGHVAMTGYSPVPMG